MIAGSRPLRVGDRVRFRDDSDEAYDGASLDARWDGSWEGEREGTLAGTLSPEHGIEDGWVVRMPDRTTRWVGAAGLEPVGVGSPS